MVRIHSSRAVPCLERNTKSCTTCLVEVLLYDFVLIPEWGSTSAAGATRIAAVVLTCADCSAHLTADVFDFTLRSGSGAASVQPRPQSASPRELPCPLEGSLGWLPQCRQHLKKCINLQCMFAPKWELLSAHVTPVFLLTQWFSSQLLASVLFTGVCGEVISPHLWADKWHRGTR